MVIEDFTFVISIERPRGGLKWRNLFKTDFSTPLRYARNDTNNRINYSQLV